MYHAECNIRSQEGAEEILGQLTRTFTWALADTHKAILHGNHWFGCRLETQLYTRIDGRSTFVKNGHGGRFQDATELSKLFPFKIVWNRLAPKPLPKRLNAMPSVKSGSELERDEIVTDQRNFEDGKCPIEEARLTSQKIHSEVTAETRYLLHVRAAAAPTQKPLPEERSLSNSKAESTMSKETDMNLQKQMPCIVRSCINEDDSWPVGVVVISH